MSQLLEMSEYPEISTEYSTVARTFIDIKKMGYDPKIIVSKYEEFYKKLGFRTIYEKMLYSFEMR